MKRKIIYAVLSYLIILSMSLPVSAQSLDTYPTNDEVSTIEENTSNLYEFSDDSSNQNVSDGIIIEPDEMSEYFSTQEELDSFIESSELIANPEDAIVSDSADGAYVEFPIYAIGEGNTNSRAQWVIVYATVIMYKLGAYYRYEIVPMPWAGPLFFKGTTRVTNRSGLSMGTVTHTSLAGSRKYYAGGRMVLSGTVSSVVYGNKSILTVLQG